VLSLLRGEEPAGVLARRYGVSENTPCRWRDEFMTVGEAALANGKGKADPRDRRIFIQVLQLCQKAGLVKLGHIALDGTKVKANASRHKAMSYGRMKQDVKGRLNRIKSFWVAKPT